MSYCRTPRRIALGLALLAAPACAQAPADPAQAPLPAALTSAAKLFLGNAGDQENADCLRAYNGFYAALHAQPQFQLVTTPAAADLVLELHYEIDLGQAIASHDAHHSVRQFRLALLDPPTHATLWSLTERTNYALFQSNRNKNLDETVTRLAADFVALTAAHPPANDSRVKHSLVP